MKFLADMGISQKTVKFLQDLGHNAVHLSEQGLERLPDPGILRKAREETSVLLTHDLGFGELVAASGAQLPSIIVFRLRKMHPERVNHFLVQVIGQYHDLLERGAILSVTEGHVRMRILPLRREDE